MLILPVGKRVTATTWVIAMGDCNVSVAKFNNRLCVYDSATNMKFLIDTGPDVSCKPIQGNQYSYQHIPDSLELYAANHSKIKTCIKLLGLNFGLCRTFKWNFTVKIQKQLLKSLQPSSDQTFGDILTYSLKLGIKNLSMR